LPPTVLAGTEAGDVENLAFAVAAKDDPQEVEKLEKMVTDLVKKGKNVKKDDKATPSANAKSVEYVKTIINTIMLPAKKMSHTRDQMALNSAVMSLKTCVSQRQSYLNTAKSSKAAYTSASSQHNTCRHTEAGEFFEYEDRCRPSAMEVRRLQADATCAKVETAQKFKYCNYQRITDAEAACSRAKQRITAAQELCDAVKSRYRSRKSTCDHMQSTMDDAACRYAVSMKEACDSGASCYKAHEANFDHTYNRVKKSEASRRAEWRALMRMKCLVDTFENGKVEDREIEACKAKTHTPPSIDYPSKPSMGPCTVPKKYPGSAEYKAAEFDRLPPQAKGKPNAGSCVPMHH